MGHPSSGNIGLLCIKSQVNKERSDLLAELLLRAFLLLLKLLHALNAGLVPPLEQRRCVNVRVRVVLVVRDLRRAVADFITNIFKQGNAISPS